MKIYKVHKVENKEVILSGKGNHSIWEKANSLTDFSSPWQEELIKKIEFKAVHNSEKIFFQFKVDDDCVYIHPSKDKNDSINNSDRVELFFRSDASLNPYYCLEIDPLSRIMDFKAKPNKDFDFNWNWPLEEIEVKSTIETNYFIVEIAITFQSLKDLNLLKDGKIETGIYRAKYNEQEDNSFKPTWIPWIDPKTETPNFHTPSSFGALILEN
ncbi:carbohydrate-binding family 9-like protein [Polaribacter cellanae]|uniref:Endoxylanase n=1 Tax=Polaribacter cellanae TaxID=2818493 RepID=A0A975H6A0_9FLAO|nr:carbohydrate-binding family 9-like protein [Polaribacter cellanae]QTE22217.1 endoxylanase [Polaribacter cellanae]